MLLIPPPLQAILAGFLIWVLSQWLPGLSFSFLFQQPLSIVIAGIGGIIDLISVYAFFLAKTTVSPLSPQKANTLVITGFYRFSRNPMYFGMLLILIGWMLWLGNFAGILPIIAFIISITYLQIKPEEKALQEKFGIDYIHYKKQVRRWI